MRVLFVGDVVGGVGRRLLRRALPELQREGRADLVVVNGENSAGGAGITPDTARELFRAGADVITTGNHVWDRKEAAHLLEHNPLVLRPANYPEPAPGCGVATLAARDGTRVAVANLQGRVFMAPVDDPFRAADRILEELAGRVEVVLVEFHAEATSEKVALGWYLDGRVSAVVGTHTHVPTADARVLPGGTAYITDLGMTGPHDSVIGVRKEDVLERFLTQRPVRLATAAADLRLSGVWIEIAAGGRASSIERVDYRESS